MELAVGAIVMNVRSISIVIFFCIVISFAEGDSLSNDVFGEYCLVKDEKNVWNLEKYKENKPFLFSYIRCSYTGLYGVFISDPWSSFGVPMGSSSFDKNKPSKCSNKFSFDREYIFANEFKVEQTKEWANEIAGLQNKFHDLDWKVTYDSNYVRLNTSGTAKIYISGFCTEEQLKMIQERKADKLYNRK
ncbi:MULTISPECIES: hypothetical protein [unclassified Fibrobacter]|uniref:hypothetical protein n=1 Tax=unclassified Fibrobacter TaxID=2634177 RepID=UPI0009343FF8|nr:MULTISPECIES: hypothetical protein [Fibrobacter]MCQ2101158.1 hypothetical protein [Fibrobacter sp.]OWV09411.1 hypothetical protein B7992_12205 [Fibrobacter sp. UWH1]